MCIGKKFVVPAVCMAAITVFGQSAADMEKKVEQLKKSVDLGTINISDYRDKQGQKMSLVKIATEQDKDMGFDGVLRFTVELTGKNGEVWYGQITEPQAKKKADYSGQDFWRLRFSHGTLKSPEIAYAMEYGFLEKGVFVAVDHEYQKVDSADVIMARNKDSKNKLTITSRTRSDQEGADGGGSNDDGGAEAASE